MVPSAKNKYETCLRITKDAMERLVVIKESIAARRYLEFARDYFNDALYYARKGDYATALEAIAYAHGFIDAGVIAGFFKIDGYHLEAVE